MRERVSLLDVGAVVAELGGLKLSRPERRTDPGCGSEPDFGCGRTRHGYVDCPHRAVPGAGVDEGVGG
jgi:hypothetical protein